MNKLLLPALLLSSLICTVAQADAACPNANVTVTIPQPTGTADVVMYDQACVALVGTDFKVYLGTAVSFPQLTATSIPAVTTDAAGLHFTANGAVRGYTTSLTIQHVPSGKTTNMTATVGAPVSAISAATTTP